MSACTSPFWLIFTPLAKDATPDELARILDKLRRSTPDWKFKQLTPAMAALSGADCRDRGHGDVVRSLLPRELVMQNWIYKEGKIERELGMLSFQFARRLGRSLTAAEQERLAKRLSSQGAEKLAALVLDRTPEQLAAWLASENGRHR